MIQLTDQEQAAFVNLCGTATSIKTVPEFQHWVGTHVRAFFPFGMMAAVMGSILDEVVFVERFISVDYPDDFILHLQRQTKLLDRPIVARWYQDCEPQIVDESQIAFLLSTFELEELRKYELHNLAVHGLIDIQGFKGSYFSFARIPGPLCEHHRQKLRLMVPQLHQVLCKLKSELSDARHVGENPPLTPRQREILGFIAQGKTNREIAALLSRTESTIRNHVHTILSSLGVANRAEAVARLMQIR